MTDEYRCSFCGKTRSEVHKLVESSLGAFICDECVFTAAHMMIFVKPEKARKVTDEPLYDELSKALDKACEQIVTLCGTCPVDLLEIDPLDVSLIERCSKKCRYGTEAKCWRDYLLGRL